MFNSILFRDSFDVSSQTQEAFNGFASATVWNESGHFHFPRNGKPTSRRDYVTPMVGVNTHTPTISSKTFSYIRSSLSQTVHAMSSSSDREVEVSPAGTEKAVTDSGKGATDADERIFETEEGLTDAEQGIFHPEKATADTEKGTNHTEATIVHINNKVMILNFEVYD